MMVSGFGGDGDVRARLARALDTVRDGFLLIDPAGRLAVATAPITGFFSASAAWLTPGIGVARLVCAAARCLAAEAGQDVRRLLLAADRHPVELRLRDGRWLRIGAAASDGFLLVTCADVTESRAQAAALADRVTVLDNVSQGICLYGPDARVRFANRRYGEVVGVDPSLARPGASMRELLGASVAAGHHGDSSLDAVEGICRRLIEAGQRQRLVISLKTGRQVGFDFIPLADGGWLGTFEDVTERRRLEEQAAFLARNDPLTRLPNRTVLGERLDMAIAETGRGGKFALLWLNIDHFKTVNDTLGFAVGDQLLRAVGERISACVRETDLVCRLGGDEFAIIQTGLGRAEQCSEQAQRIMKAFAAPFLIDGFRIVVGVSIGIAIAPADGSHGEVLLRHADVAMERAKEDGRGTYRLFEREMDARVQARRAMESDLRQALAEDGFELYFQPLVDLASRRVSGFEALLRWHHPVQGMVPPAQFIPVAEDTGLIVQLGEWVLRAACKAAATWPARLRIAVNVSPVQFKAGGLPGMVAAALAESGLSARRLELEITESVLLTNNTATLDVLRGLRAAGVRISMDDFGTGYSSLSYLRSFPFDKIKIDQSFVRDLENSADSAAIVDAIVALGRSLGMRVTAEGVETPAQFARLREAGCDEVQGYLFSKPRPGAELAAIIARIEEETVC